MTAPERLRLEDGRDIAYHRTRPSESGRGFPGIVFLGGYASDMTGTKALFLEGWARERGRAYLRFDYTGHGASSGDFATGCVGDWAEDAAVTLERLTEGRQVLIGSSMGGWIACLLARRMPERIAALVGIAAAPDFTSELMEPDMSDADRSALRERGRIEHPNPYGPEPTIYTRKLMEDGARNSVFAEPLPAPFPVRLLHGTADADVPTWLGLKLLEHLDGADARLTLARGADHRFSGETELALLGRTLDELG